MLPVTYSGLCIAALSLWALPPKQSPAASNLRTRCPPPPRLTHIAPPLYPRAEEQGGRVQAAARGHHQPRRDSDAQAVALCPRRAAAERDPDHTRRPAGRSPRLGHDALGPGTCKVCMAALGQPCAPGYSACLSD